MTRQATENKAFRSSAMDAAKKELKDKKKAAAKEKKKSNPSTFVKGAHKAHKNMLRGKR